MTDFKQMLIGIAIIIGGINFVGLGMINNGANYASNPTWGFFQSFFYFEFTAVAIIVCGFILIQILFFVSKENVEPKPLATKIIQQRLETNDEDPPKVKQKPALIRKPPMPLPKPPPPPLPTAAELKRKALEQITGKAFK